MGAQAEAEFPDIACAGFREKTGNELLFRTNGDIINCKIEVTVSVFTGALSENGRAIIQIV